MLSRWVVPQDDTNTMFIELRHVSETEGVTPAWWADRTIMARAQLAADSYEAGQRQPGDYEAQSRSARSRSTDWSISAPPIAGS
jgi:hypothetical protein